MSSPVPAPSTPPRKRRRGLVALVVVGALGTAAVIAVRVVLSGDTPRRILIEQAGKATGLDVQVREFRLAWNGKSTAKGITLRLPLDAEPFLTADSLSITHAPLHTLLLTGDPSLAEVIVDGAAIDLAQDARGRWTFERLASLLEASLGSGSSSGGVTPIPAISIPAASLHLNHDPVPTLRFTLTGTPTAAGEYHATLTADSSSIAAAFSTATLDHSVTFSLQDLHPVVSAFLPDVPAPSSLRGSWAGGLSDGNPTGLLTLDELRIGEDSLSGSLTLAVAGDVFTLSPRSLTLATPRFDRQPVTIAGGRVRISGPDVSATQANVTLPGLQARVSGSWNLDAEEGNAHIVWEGAEPAHAVSHTGTADLRASLPAGGRHTLLATIRTDGSAQLGTWSSEAVVNLSTEDWDALDVTLSTPHLLVTDAEGTLDFSSSTFDVHYSDSVVTLRSLTVPFARSLRASGRYDTASHRWAASLEASSLTVPRLATPLSQVRALASGEGRRMQVSDLSLQSEGLTLGLSGTYDPDRPSPLEAIASFHRPLPELLDPPATDQPPAVPPVAFGTVAISGDPIASRAQAEGLVTFANLRYQGETLPSRELSARVTWSRDSIAVETSPFAFIGGETAITAGLDLSTRSVVGHARIACIDLGQAAALVDPDLRLAGDGFADLAFRFSDFDPHSAEVYGTWVLDRVTSPAGPIESGRGRLAVRFPDVHLSEVLLTRGVSSVGGDVRLDVNTPEFVTADLRLNRYGYEDAELGVSAMIDGHATARIDLTKREANGTVTLEGVASLDGQPLSTVRAEATLSGRTAETTSLRANLFGGSVTGGASLPVDDWTKLALNLEFSDVELSQLRPFVPRSQLSGLLGGTVSVRPAKEKSALGPMRFETDLSSSNGAWGPMAVHRLKMTGYAGAGRAVVDEGGLDLAAGSLAFWSRFSSHDGEPFVHLSLDAQGLDLAQLVAAAAPGAPPVVGTVSGVAILGGYLSEPHRGFGDADIRVVGADIGNLPVVSQLYGLLKLELGEHEPNGVGQVRLRLEGDAVEIERVQYFNRGADLFGTGRIHNVWLGDQSEVSGSVGAAVRPLRDSKLPFGQGVDRIIAGLFENAVSVRISGMLSEPEIKTVPFADVSSGLRRMLGAPPPQ